MPSKTILWKQSNNFLITAQCTQVQKLDMKSEVILNIHSDASRVAENFFLGWLPQDIHPISLNGPIHNLTYLLQLVAVSADEA